LYPISSQPGADVQAFTSEYAWANGFFVNPRLSSILEAEARQSGAMRKNFALSYLNFNGRTYHVVYHFLYDEDERRVLRGAEGFLADPDHLRQHYFGEIVAMRGRAKTPNAGIPTMAMSILNDDGAEVSRSGRSLLTNYESEVRFPFLFFDPDLFDSLSPYRPQVRYWTVRTGYEAGDVANIARQASANQRGAWVLVGLVAIGGIVSIAAATVAQLRLAQMQSEFVASVSHDLKTPLAKIQLFAETLESGRARTPEKAEIYQHRIGAQARKLSQLIGALLDFSKFEAGVRHYPVEEIDLRPLIRNCADMFEDELGQDGYTVEVTLPPSEVAVLANGDGLQQLFGNLISNAIKYSPRERFLRIALSTVNGCAVVEVTDHGMGIPPREQRKIFKKFYRGDEAVAMAVPGSGIGLAIVKHLARAHRGKVFVISTRGRGSTFRVELPMIVDSSLETPA
jgi:signal transduction histidine kinase